ncbi:MAG: hypothetical protein Kilf2KO_07680 [Rhodospirillales bacterium]
MSSQSSIAEALACLQAGDWEGAHALVAADPSAEAAWLHAHLHRVEGDHSNAQYWYARAGRVAPTVTLAEERQALLSALTKTAA